LHIQSEENNVDQDQDDMDDFESVGAPRVSSSSEGLLADRKPISLSSSSALSHKKQPSKLHKSNTSKGLKPTRTVNGMEDVFSHTQVRTWSEVRIKTWEHRRTNVEGFYYRFVGTFRTNRHFIFQMDLPSALLRYEEMYSNNIICVL
jgi:hypothetical protein